MTSGVRVLIVEDEFIVAMTMKDELSDAGYDVVGMAGTAAKAVELATEGTPDIVLMDVRLKGQGDGVDAAYRIREKDAACAVVFVTGSTEPQVLERIERFRPAGLVIKPAQFRDIDRAIRAALEAEA